jgi:hypothetical protein
VVNHKGNATALEHVGIIKRFVEEFGIERIQRVYGDREFGSYQLFAYLIKNEIDFHIRMKTSHKTAGKSFRQLWKNVSERVCIARKSENQSIWVGDLCQLCEVSKDR